MHAADPFGDMEMAIMPLAMVEDLLIVARERVVVPRLDGTAARLEIRLESRRTERRRGICVFQFI